MPSCTTVAYNSLVRTERGRRIGRLLYKLNWPHPFRDKKVLKDVESIVIGNHPLYLRHFHPR